MLIGARSGRGGGRRHRIRSGQSSRFIARFLYRHAGLGIRGSRGRRGGSGGVGGAGRRGQGGGGGGGGGSIGIRLPVVRVEQVVPVYEVARTNNGARVRAAAFVRVHEGELARPPAHEVGDPVLRRPTAVRRSEVPSAHLRLHLPTVILQSDQTENILVSVYSFSLLQIVAKCKSFNHPI